MWFTSAAVPRQRSHSWVLVRRTHYRILLSEIYLVILVIRSSIAFVIDGLSANSFLCWPPFRAHNQILIFFV
jgi:hypothetical protein